MSSEPRLLFFGSLFYPPNSDGIKWFCERVWPKILKALPDAGLDIVGAQGERLEFLKSITNVTVHGFVEDLHPLQSEAAALIVPLRIAGGTRIKILEAWAQGLPVVSTSIGAEGLGVQNREQLLLADGDEEFAAACVELLEHSELREDLARRGHAYGSAHYDWRVIWPVEQKVIEEVLRDSK